MQAGEPKVRTTRCERPVRVAVTAAVAAAPAPLGAAYQQERNGGWRQQSDPNLGQAVKNGACLLPLLSASSLVALIRSAVLWLSEMNLTTISFPAL